MTEGKDRRGRGPGAARPGAAHGGAPAPNRYQAYIRAQRMRGYRSAAISSVAVVLAAWFLIPLAPGWERVRQSFFNWEIIEKSWEKLLRAFLIDVMIFAWAAPSILVFALVVALARNVKAPALFPLKAAAILFIDFFRAVPVILTVYIIGFGIPGLGLMPPWNSPYLWGTVALVLTYSAYMAEVYRSGIESIHRSQTAAAQSLGFSNGDVMRFVVLPQAVSRVMPSLMNFMISLQKDVALLSFIGPVEVLRQANVLKSLYANFTPYVVAAVLFLSITIPATRYADYLIARQNAREGR